MFFRLRDAGFGRRRLPRSTGAVNASRFFSFRLPCPNLILPCLIPPRLIGLPFVNSPVAAAPIIALPGMTLVGPIALVFNLGFDSNRGFDRRMGISMRR
jgi:hypothetical protein